MIVTFGLTRVDNRSPTNICMPIISITLYRCLAASFPGPVVRRIVPRLCGT
jgi:hypothetical protein